MSDFERDDNTTVDLLSEVGVNVYEEDIADWTDKQVQEAENWASAMYASTFSGVEVPPRPEWIEITAA